MTINADVLVRTYQSTFLTDTIQLARSAAYRAHASVATEVFTMTHRAVVHWILGCIKEQLRSVAKDPQKYLWGYYMMSILVLRDPAVQGQCSASYMSHTHHVNVGLKQVVITSVN